MSLIARHAPRVSPSVLNTGKLTEIIPTTAGLLRRRLLLVDGHGSHVTGNFVGFCFHNNIDLVVLPSHTFQITQPLDVGIFGPLKAAMARQTDEMARYDPRRIQRSLWATQLLCARSEAMTERNIRVGWSKTGLYPFFPGKVLTFLPDRNVDISSDSQGSLAAVVKPQ